MIKVIEQDSWRFCLMHVKGTNPCSDTKVQSKAREESKCTHINQTW